MPPWEGLIRVSVSGSGKRFGPFEALDPGVGIETLVRELTDYSRSWKAPRAIALILDDFHSITVATVLEQFAYFLDYCPDLLHCLIISRHVPRTGAQPSVACDTSFFELGPEDLRFDLASSERFLARRLDLRLSPSHLRVLLSEDRRMGCGDTVSRSVAGP